MLLLSTCKGRTLSNIDYNLQIFVSTRVITPFCYDDQCKTESFYESQYLGAGTTSCYI